MATAPPEDVGTSDDHRQLTSQGRERKQQLVDCAAALFAERGFDETRIKDIVEAAGVAKGLFYWYFENKEALFAEVASDIRLRLRKRQAEAMADERDVLRLLRRGTEASLRFMAENAHFFSLLEAETGALDERTRRAGTAQHVGDTEALIRRGQEEGVVIDENPHLLALGVVGNVGFYSHYHRTGRAEVSIDELTDFVVRSVLRMVAADEHLVQSALE